MSKIPFEMDGSHDLADILLSHEESMPPDRDDDFRRSFDNPVETLRRDFRRDVKEQLDEVKAQLRDIRDTIARERKEDRDELKSSVNERLSGVEQRISALESGKAGKNSEYLMYGLLVMIATYVVNLWLGAIELDRGPTDPPPPPPAAARR
jgi:hypothetical protein